ncbi:hypothetical protein STRIP9103_00797 [Streptomyces ipomoeae 91-03]|uniref:Uncharacterized protein n=1 Tax=Streptomyces ipomoeae 91-03 TaxID=698759 RepID=L1L1L0_9ACTN|nr:hypothetical protein STRIP9103_00797 [Streptomyces ipomoeae 91-03]
MTGGWCRTLARVPRCSTNLSGAAPQTPFSHQGLPLGAFGRVRVGCGWSRPRGGAACRYSLAPLQG